MEFGEMKRNTSNWSNFGMLLRRAGLTASAGLSCLSFMRITTGPPVGPIIVVNGLIDAFWWHSHSLYGLVKKN